MYSSDLVHRIGAALTVSTALTAAVPAMANGVAGDSLNRFERENSALSYRT
jgi:hypothetical protein